MPTQPFLNPPVSREEIRRQLGLEPHHVAVGTIARLFHLKGHEDILEMAPRLCAQFPDLRFLWIGDGILRQQFEQQMNQMNLRDRFILTGLGPPSRIPELTNAMDILLHPSRREGLARAIPQGQLAGCPALAYDIDGNREGMIPNQTGFAIPPFDKQELERRLAQLLADPQLRQSMGTAGQRFAVLRFDVPVMIEGLEKVYTDVLSRKEQ
jgi:glycosyltransferase involved in cell wall biosynthesis